MRYLKDLLLTDTFLLKGHVNTGGKRLSTFLNATPRRYVEMEEVSLVPHSQPNATSVSRMLVRVDEILLAHEMDEAGDKTMKILAERERDEAPVVAYFGGTTPIRVAGKASRRVIDRDAADTRDFLVILEPVIRGITKSWTKEYSVLIDLPYIIVNRGRIAFICQ